jgi:hypothetical protein
MAKKAQVMTHNKKPVTVLFIMGLGRSGSTILDIVLGNHPDIESVGEVCNLSFTGWVSRDALHGIEQKKLRLPVCTCGKRLDVPAIDDEAEACPFWSRVRREWVQRAGRDDVESYPALQDAFERHRDWPRLLYAKYKPSARFSSYARLTRAFFESIRAVSGKPIIVDSSKDLVRAFALSMVPGIDLRLVHLVRDGRGVIASRRKTFQKDLQAGIEWDHEGHPMWKSLVRWVGLNLEAEWICGQLDPAKTTRLRYEDFVGHPANALEQIGALVGLDFTDVADAASSGATMLVGHNCGGNRMRKSESIRLQSGAGTWENALSPTEEQLSWALIGWLMRRYGYKRIPAL